MGDGGSMGGQDLGLGDVMGGQDLGLGGGGKINFHFF